MQECKYRLPCGRCEKYNRDCDAPKECNHNWAYDTKQTDSYDENGNRYYLMRKFCIKCGVVEEKLRTCDEFCKELYTSCKIYQNTT